MTPEPGDTPFEMPALTSGYPLPQCEKDAIRRVIDQARAEGAYDNNDEKDD